MLPTTLAVVFAVASAASAADTASAFPAGIGPLRQALSEARAWRTDACFSGVSFNRWRQDYFTLHFHSDAEPLESFNYATDGPYKGGSPGPRAGIRGCLPSFELDAKAAIEAATAAGFRSGSNGWLHATLSVMDEWVMRAFKKTGRPVRLPKARTVWFVSTLKSCWAVDAVNARILYSGPYINDCL